MYIFFLLIDKTKRKTSKNLNKSKMKSQSLFGYVLSIPFIVTLGVGIITVRVISKTLNKCVK
jgi:hypothetical protein